MASQRRYMPTDSIVASLIADHRSSGNKRKEQQNTLTGFYIECPFGTVVLHKFLRKCGTVCELRAYIAACSALHCIASLHIVWSPFINRQTQRPDGNSSSKQALLDALDIHKSKLCLKRCHAQLFRGSGPKTSIYRSCMHALEIIYY